MLHRLWCGRCRDSQMQLLPLWEVGKPPDFVAEVTSESTSSNDLGESATCARLDVRKYWCFDATGGSLYGSPLAGERLVDGDYEPYELRTDAGGTVWSHSTLLNLDFRWTQEAFRVRNQISGEHIVSLIEERDARILVKPKRRDNGSRIGAPASAEAFQKRSRLGKHTSMR